MGPLLSLNTFLFSVCVFVCLCVCVFVFVFVVCVCVWGGGIMQMVANSTCIHMRMC